MKLNELGKEIKLLRKEKNWSQDDLENIQVSQNEQFQKLKMVL